MKLLYGKSKEKNIVAIEPIKGQNVVEVFTREKGVLSSQYEIYKPFCFVNDKDPILNALPDVKTTKLFGNNHYNVMIEAEDPGSIFYVRKMANDCLMPYIDSQYMLKTGKTLFKGMGFNDPLVMFFDLEVYTHPDYNFPNAQRDSDEIIMIAVRFNDGYEEVIVNEGEYGEVDLIERFIELVFDRDPDVLVNHNIFNFDLQYLLDRCTHHNMKLILGRNGSEPKTFNTKIKFAEREREYTNFDIYGRHVIDTQFLVEYADVVNRELPSYKLKEVVKYLGRASEEREYIEGSDISRMWDTDKEKLLRYALDDVREAEILYNEYGQAVFKMTPMIPMSYQEVFRYGTGSQIEYVFIREYMRQKWSLPKAGSRREFSGGYADVLKFGLIRDPIVYGDVKSLYPTLAKLLGIQPKKDELKIFQMILKELTDTRFEIKDKIKKLTDPGEIKQQKATDGAIKIFLNTMAYGFLGWEFGIFNDFNEAERITVEGQRIIKLMNEFIELDGGVPIKVDTDGTAFIVPEKYRGSLESEQEYIDTLTERMPKGIIIEHDGRYKGMIAIDKKSYAMMEYDGKMKVKGNTLRGRNVEPFVTSMVKDCVKHLLNGEEEKCTEIFQYWKERIQTKQVTPEEIQSRKNLNMSLEEYKNRRESEELNTIAQYEVALNSDTLYQKGDTVIYYVSEFPIVEKTLKSGEIKRRKAKVPLFKVAKEIKHYNNDLEIDHYLDRLELGVKKFIVLGKDMFERLFDVSVKAVDKRKYEKVTKKSYEHFSQET